MPSPPCPGRAGSKRPQAPKPAVVSPTAQSEGWPPRAATGGHRVAGNEICILRSNYMLKLYEAHERAVRLPGAATQTNPSAVSARDGECGDQDRWARVKKQLGTDVGAGIFLSWFASMDLMGVAGDTVRFSVPPRLLNSWMKAH